jgi:hypothetical protein
MDRHGSVLNPVERVGGSTIDEDDGIESDIDELMDATDEPTKHRDDDKLMDAGEQKVGREGN